ncbi:MAG: aldehyde ferredoxin oxidoreductase family protein [Desulfobacterales bacterium]|nr:aldehyde ferredoxin oxidoreductase family protein [Desulfobacterales bacterium]
MNKGYIGKILMIDLTNKEIIEEKIPDSVYEEYLSGLGLGAYILYDRIPKGADPLGPDNILGFISGLLTGSGTLFTGRWMVVGKSPLTGGWGDANCGGNFSPAIKKCGYDGIFFKGISEKPVYLYVNNNKAELRDASHIWGKDAIESEEILCKESEGKNPRVATIGTSGEKLSFISGICNDKGRIAARAGLGAVMGSKKLKGIVLTGSQLITSYNRNMIKRHNITLNLWVKFQPPFVPGSKTSYVGALLRSLPVQVAQDGLLYKILLKKWGTVSMNQISIETGDAPIKNWGGTNVDFGPDKSIAVNPDAIINKEIKKYYCYSCPLGCGGICDIKNNKYNKEGYEETHKPEYESVVALGGLCMNEDVDSIFYLNEVLNRAGMDTISAGTTVAFAIECYENGILTKEDTDGLELKWGNTDAIIQLIHKMINREGIGDILADGVKKASEKMKKNSDKFAIHAGGQELAMHDGRNDPGFALHYCVEPTPGRHTIGSQLYYEMFKLWKKIKDLPSVSHLYGKNKKYIPDENKVKMAVACSKFMNVANGTGLCLFGALLGVNRLPIFEWINEATGWQKTPEDYMEIGARIQTLKQKFNILHGIDPKKNMANERTLGVPPLPNGANKEKTVDVEQMIGNYWTHFGWDKETGKP